jgi:putative nucleotidyltransferase with HDIG domain
MEILTPLVLSFGIFKQFEEDTIGTAGFSLEKLWAHSMKVGTLAKHIANTEKLGSSTIEDSLLAGMLHDIGKLILILNLPEAYTRFEERTQLDQVDRLQAEIETFGATHGAVGAYLLGLWGLPDPVIEAVALHNQPSAQAEQTFCTLSIVHIANALIHESETGREVNDLLDFNYLESVKVKDRIQSWRGLVGHS